VPIGPRLAFSVLLALAPVLRAQTGPQILTFRSSADGSAQPYSIYVPRSFDAARRYPLVVSLHSEESDHRFNLRQVLAVPSRIGEMNPSDMHYLPAVRDLDFIVACPFARGTMGYEGPAEQDVYDMLADVEQRFPIDRDRVYLTGISMGGGGALRLALTRPDVWAAVAPLCPIEEPGTEEVLGNALDLPVRLYHGDGDPIVPAQSSRDLQRKLLDAGARAEYFEYPGVRHNVWDFAYRNGAVFQWFAQQRRNAFPQRVRFLTRSYRYAEAYWVRIDELTPGTEASIDARLSGTNTVQVETKNLSEFTLKPLHPLAAAVIDGSVVRVRTRGAVSFEQIAGKWRLRQTEVTTLKRAGSEGPIAAAFTGAHIYVYGSLGARTDDELAARRNTAETAAAWNDRYRVAVTPLVKPDSEITAADIACCNLILFGNAETNSVIARFASSLPLSLNPGAADYGLVFIAPQGSHYVVVNSGLPWWTGAAEAGRGGDSFQPRQLRIVSAFGDYMLFRGSLEHVVAEGRFDSSWKLPPAAAAKMAATGTITIQK